VDPILYVLAAVVLVVAVVAVGYLLWRRRRQPPAPPAGRVVATPPRGGLVGGLTKTSRALGEALGGVFHRSDLDDGFWQRVEDALIAADVGVAPSVGVVERARERRPEDPPAALEAVRAALLTALDADGRELRLVSKPSVVVVVGVNGVGKTTTIAKLAALVEKDGRRALLGAADTFRAAADAQLRTWADRVGVDVVGGQPGSDPAAIAFDAYNAARGRGADVLVVDTAGRLHSKHNLMQELGKVVKVLQREAGSIDEVLLILDATAGQNGLAQARVFTETVGVTGIVLTKMDGTARGGIAVAVEQELGVPVKLVGVGEGIDDLVAFQPGAYVDALLADA
jgi:fused signal recognition particle receptor